MKNQANRYGNVPWVFWFTVSVRKGWFSYWWKTRGYNYIEFQVGMFKISIGRPWLFNVVTGHFRGYGSLHHIHTTNTENLKAPYSIYMAKGTSTVQPKQ